jgi:hypothetical protein
MRARSLDQLVSAGLLQPKAPDPARVGTWIAQARRDLDLAVNVLASIDRQRAMAVAYEGGFRACAAVVDLAGFRVTSQPGHHRAAIEAAGSVLGSEWAPTLRQLDAARRRRNDMLYAEPAPVSRPELEGLIAGVGQLVGIAQARLEETER